MLRTILKNVVKSVVKNVVNDTERHKKKPVVLRDRNQKPIVEIEECDEGLEVKIFYRASEESLHDVVQSLFEMYVVLLDRLERHGVDTGYRVAKGLFVMHGNQEILTFVNGKATIHTKQMGYLGDAILNVYFGIDKANSQIRKIEGDRYVN